MRRRASPLALLAAAAAAALALSACGDGAPAAASGPPRHVVVSGSPFEMGEALGKALRAEIAEAVGPRLAATFRGAPSDAGGPAFLESTCRAYAKETKPFLPESVREELRGLAAGSGRSEEDLLLLDVVREGLRWHGERPRGLEGAFSSPPAEGAEGRTGAFVAWQGFSADGVEGRLVVVERRPTEGRPTIVLAAAGSLGALAGVSDSLWAAQAEVVLDRKRGSLKGPPFSIGFRTALERASDLEGLWERLPKTSGHRVLAGVSAPGGARRVGLVAYAGDDPVDHAATSWVLGAAGEGAEAAPRTARQDALLGSYAARPGREAGLDLALAGRDEGARGPVALLGAGTIGWLGSAPGPASPARLYRLGESR